MTQQDLIELRQAKDWISSYPLSESFKARDALSLSTDAGITTVQYALAAKVDAGQTVDAAYAEMVA